MSTFIIKDYVVNRKLIGKGSFSTIYKAFNTNNNNEYAIKEIIIDKKSIKSTVKREFIVLKKLNHPNIVKLHDLIVDTNYNNIYFVFDYFKNGDLAKFLDNKPLKEKYCKKYSKQLADGLQYLIKNDILHRDLKPQNILLTDDYNIKIADFGFARKVDKDMLLNTLCGSPMYMAPEIINKQDYSIKSDLWSVGIIIYQMIYGRVPYEVNNFVQLIKKINSEPINYSVNGIEPSSQCKHLIQNLLQIDVSKRLSWDDFFFNPWFVIDDIMVEDNNLLDFSISNNSSIPKLNRFKHHVGENQFASFIHKSIKLKESSELSLKLEDKNKKNKHQNDQENDIEINFLESINNSDNEDESEEEDNELMFASCNSSHYNDTNLRMLVNDTKKNENNFDSIDSNEIIFNSTNKNKCNKNYHHKYNTRSKTRKYRSDSNYDVYDNKDNYDNCKTKPIKIPSNKKYNYRDDDNSDYEVIGSNEIIQHSEPIGNKTISESFKEYLYESINLLKHSYKYITNNKSI